MGFLENRRFRNQQQERAGDPLAWDVREAHHLLLHAEMVMGRLAEMTDTDEATGYFRARQERARRDAQGVRTHQPRDHAPRI